jgi:hypothetical protein
MNLQNQKTSSTNSNELFLCFLYFYSMIQNILVALTAIGAVIYIGRGVYKSFQNKNSAGCAMGCGKCAEAAQKLPANH